MSDDLYAELGLSKGASDADIKRAYRRLARQHHPDVNKDPGAEDKFKRIQRAYSILSDSQKRAQYDQFGVADDSPGGGQGFGGFGGGGFEGFSDSFEDIFDAFFGGSRRSSQRGGPRRGEDLRYDLELTLEEAAKGIKKEIEVFHMEKCSRCSGSGAQPGTGKSKCSHCQGSGQIKTVQRTLLGSFSQVTTCHHCNGSGEMIQHKCLQCQGHGIEKNRKKIQVDIPGGVDQGTRLRVSGEGNHGEHGGPPGDLYVFISVKRHKYFVREESDIYLDIELPLTKAVLGSEVEVPTLEGKAKLKIPAGTQPNTVLRLKGKGLPNLRGFGKGDQHVRVSVTIPKKVSGKEKGLFEEIASIRGDNASKSHEMDFVKAQY